MSLQAHHMKLDPWSIKIVKVKNTDETGYTTTDSLELSHVLTVV